MRVCLPVDCIDKTIARAQGSKPSDKHKPDSSDDEVEIVMDSTWRIPMVKH